MGVVWQIKLPGVDSMEMISLDVTKNTLRASTPIMPRPTHPLLQHALARSAAYGAQPAGDVRPR